MFVTGTAVVIAPVGSVTYKGIVIEAKKPKGELSLALKTKLEDIQVSRSSWITQCSSEGSNTRTHT